MSESETDDLLKEFGISGEEEADDGDGEGAAAEWAAMIEGNDDSEDGAAVDRILNQDEIDNLLGFDSGDMGIGDLSGVQALINSALVSYERLPMLEIVFDRLVRLTTTSLRNFTSDNVESISIT